MATSTKGNHQYPSIRHTVSFIFILLVLCIPASILLKGTTTHASSMVPHNKPPISPPPPKSNTLPTATVSRYITRKDTPTALTTAGCNQAKAFVGGVVILDFGETVFQNGTYGTTLPGTTTGFVSNTTMKTLLKQYLKGYAGCDTNTSGASLILGIGTDNGGPYMTSIANASAAGQEWANMVVTINTWIASQGFAHKEKAFGAIQIELEFNTAVITRGWVDGFGTVASNTGINYINYGDATGCPTVDSTANGPCSNGWTQLDLAYVSWDAIAGYPLPQIYDTAGTSALQWQSIEYYQRINNLGGSLGPMYIQGSVTQFQACQQTGGCPGTNNAPGAGWQQIYNALQSSSVTAQPIVWDSTDFQWDF